MSHMQLAQEFQPSTFEIKELIERASCQGMPG